MSRWVFLAVVAAALGLTGCSVIEQYHYQPELNQVPVKVKVAFSEAYPNDAVIKTITEQRMFDGSTRYSIVMTNAKFVDTTVVFTADGKEIKDHI